MAPYDFKRGQTIKTDAAGVVADRSFLAHLKIAAVAAVAASANGIHAAVASTGAQQVITTGITNPAVPRNVTATAGGTAADIKAIQVIVEGTNYNDEVITETLPVFTENTAGAVTGSKAFKTVTKITIPAHDGTGATTAIGWGDKFGLPYKLEADEQVILKLFNKSADTGSVTNSETNLELNTFDPNGSPDGLKDIDLYIVV